MDGLQENVINQSLFIRVRTIFLFVSNFTFYPCNNKIENFVAVI